MKLGKARPLVFFLVLLAGWTTHPSHASLNSARREPRAISPLAGQTNPTATFRVTLNGFRVNHESDDDIFEGDGRGDEIFITAHRWIVNRDGSARPLPADDGSQYLQTKVMGDPNGHPERVPAGTKSPGLRLDSAPGGLQTGDTFPSRNPAVRNRDPLPDRPPIILWQGELTQGQNLVEILPIIWEWDSPNSSASERAILEGGLTAWFESHRQKLANHISAADLPTVPYAADRLPADVSGLNGNPRLYDGIQLSDKAGTRPIGYREDRGLYGVDFDQYFFPLAVVLTYDSAINALNPRNQNQRVLQIRYQDSHDHGDYTLYLQIEQVTSLRQTIPLRPVRPQ